MTTNITAPDMRRKFLIYADVPLRKYIELYEQVFDIDLYAYRIWFRCENSPIEKI
jgi:hypothetical protein